MPTYSGSLTVAQIATRVKRQFGDEVGSQITDADIIRWVDDAQRDLALNNQLLQVKGTTALVAGTADYTLPPEILTLHSVKYAGQKLRGLSLQEADEFISSNPAQAINGTPTNYFMWANTLTLYPTPDASALAAGGSSLVIYYTRQPIQVSATTDVPELPSQYHNRIVEYCIAQAYELDDNMQGAQMKMSQFKQGADMMKDNESWQQRDVYPSITVSADDTMAEGMVYNYYGV